MSMDLHLRYGNKSVEAMLPWGRCLDVLEIAEVPALADPQREILGSLQQPIGLDRSVFELVHAGESIAIVVSDAFRNTAVDQVLPVLIGGLNYRGILDESIIVVFASGTHRPPTPEEQARILGPEMYARLRSRCYTHDPNDESNLIYIGITSRGTPIEINKRVYDCDRIIATGTVVMHYFGGFGGGRKSIVPGISSSRTIAHNHAMNLHAHEDRLNPAVRIAALDGNPVAEDMLEGARLARVDCIINTVLDKEGRIARVFAGELDAAHRAAAEYARSLYSVHIRKRANLVIASAGEARNFIQSHKALYNAFQAMEPGGRIVLLASCAEGLGSERYASWLRLGSAKAIIRELRKASEIYGQTALSTVEKGPSAILVTELPDQAVSLLGATKAATIAEALEMARADLFEAGISNPTYYVMPSAAYTVPFVVGSEDKAQVTPGLSGFTHTRT
ncbi:MAG: nickel-dependent lactate racemase [Candidatus Hydrogenedentes bacterium]|nr:nickel-dependent lactate racemase [Candidatus Hydrogenedentota bacterium]